LGPMVEKKHAKLTIIEQLDIKLLSQLLQKQLSPFVIRLDKTDPFGFTREWAIVSMPPERHMAYALQWFVMALVLFIIVIVLSFKKKL
jgi:surfeit locus 1 family protein